MKKNGFTLIELLAVIIILALLMIIVFPSVINSIKSSGESTEDQVSSLIKNAAKLYIDDNYTKSTKNTYCIPISDLIETKNLDEEMVAASENITSKHMVEVKYNNKKKEFSYNISSTCTENYVCNFTNDVDNDKQFDVGDEITCGTESFYVISDDGDNIQMLAKYRLNKERGVQNTKEETDYENKVYVKGEAEQFTTEELVIIAENSVRCFSSELYWLDETEKILPQYRTDGLIDNYYVFDKTKLGAAPVGKCTKYVVDYVVAYEKKLKEEIGVATANATLMSYEQALDLGCKGYKDETGDYYNCSSAPDWVRSTTYWLGTYRKLITDVSKIHRVWSIDYDESFDMPKYQEDTPYHGVRPVIKILKKEINIP